jgi:hypothetical protein
MIGNGPQNKMLVAFDRLRQIGTAILVTVSPIIMVFQMAPKQSILSLPILRLISN